MDRRERIDSLHDSVMMALEGHQAQVWTAMPGQVISFDSSEQTCSVQLTVQVQVQSPDGSFNWVTISPLIHCPVQFPSGGGATLTFPVQSGDECLVVFASRCIDAWWQQSGIQQQAEFRMHDLSDGFVLLGFRSKPRAVANVSSTDVQLRSDDGLAFLGINPSTHVLTVQTPAAVNVVSTASVNVTAPAITLGAIGQTLTSFVTEAFKTLFNNHTHTTTTTGNPTSSPNTPMGAGQLSTTVKGG